MLTQEELDNRFNYHAPSSEEKQQAHSAIRSECKKLAEFMNIMLPESREKALVMTKLEELMFWANACEARSN